MARALADSSAQALTGGAAAVGAGELIDPLSGRADLEAGVLRVLGVAAYEADSLRPLRLARFAAELGFAPDPDTERLTAQAAPRVAEAAGERVSRSCAGSCSRRACCTDWRWPTGWGCCGRCSRSWPICMTSSRATTTTSTSTATIEVVEHLIELEAQATGWLRAALDEPLADELTRGQALRFGALLHDIGKPATHALREGGRVTFIGHDRLGQEMIAELGRRLRTSTRLSSLSGISHVTTSCSASWSTSGRSTVGMSTAIWSAHRPCRWRSRPLLRRPAGHPRAQGRRGDRGPSGACRSADGGRARLA